MFRTVPLSIISFSLYIEQWYMSYRFAYSCRAAVSKQRKSKRVEFHSKNKFEKLVHLVGFTVSTISRRAVAWTSNYEFCFVTLL